MFMYNTVYCITCIMYNTGCYGYSVFSDFNLMYYYITGAYIITKL